MNTKSNFFAMFATRRFSILPISRSIYTQASSLQRTLKGRRNEKERKKREWSGHYMKNAAQFAKTRSIPRAPLSFPRFLFTAPASSALNVPGSLMEPTWPWAHLENRIPNLTANFALPRLLEFLHWTSRRWSRLHLSKTSWPKDCKKIYIYI